MQDDSTAALTGEMIARTHPGARDNNEDCVHCDAAAGVMIVADGVGGYRAGEVASRLACEVIAEQLAQGVDPESAVHAANRAISTAQSEDTSRRRMASTVVVGRSHQAGLDLAWVGDSRAYLWVDDTLSLLTRDHSLVADLIDDGQVTWLEAFSHPQRNVILQALGQSATRDLDVATLRIDRLPAESVLMLCTDGLSDVLEPLQLSRQLANVTSRSLTEVADCLVEAAVSAGGRDNLSLALCRPAQWGVPAGALDPGAVARRFTH